MHALGVILAGGRSRRFGAAKAFSEVGGLTLVERVRRAYEAVPLEVVVIGSDPRLDVLRLPRRSDLRPDTGPLGGLETALHWARERGARGVVLAGCDMPFVAPALLRAILHEAARSGATAVVPETESAPHLQPLCAWYAVDLLPLVVEFLDAGVRGMGELVERAGALRLSPAEVARHGDPATMFLNVNTPEDRVLAERLAEREHDRAQ